MRMMICGKFVDILKENICIALHEFNRSLEDTRRPFAPRALREKLHSKI